MLGKQIRNLVKDAKEHANKRKVELARAVLFNLTETTPLLTSKAVSNWQLGIDSAKTDVLAPIFMYSENSRIANFTRNSIKLDKVKFGHTLYITNNVHYIDLLNEGYSTQAPPQFIENAVQKAIRGVYSQR